MVSLYYVKIFLSFRYEKFWFSWIVQGKLIEFLSQAIKYFDAFGKTFLIVFLTFIK